MKQKQLFRVLAAAGLVVSAGSALAATESDTFTATAVVQQGLEVNCNSGTVDFGTISVPVSYDGSATVTVAAAEAQTATTDGNLIVVDGASLGCAVSGIQSTADAVLEGAGGTWDDVDTLEGIALTISEGAQTMSADITLSDASELADGTIYVGGALSVGSLTSNPAGTYTSADITLTITE